MSLWRHIIRGVRALQNRQAADKEIADEVQNYLEEATAAFIAKGLPADKARRAAQLELGSMTSVREQVRGYGWENRLDILFADLRYTTRRLAGNPGFATVSILILALGIGAATAIFSVVDAVLLRALPYPNQEKIVRVWEQAPDGHGMNLAGGNFQDLRAQNNTLVALAAYDERLSSISGGSEPVRTRWSEVSTDFFKALGVEPFLGRAFTVEEHRRHSVLAAVVSHAYWRRYLASVTDLSKVQLQMEGEVYQVLGVMPEAFDFPAGAAVWTTSEIDLDLSRSAHNWRALGRVRDGVTVAQARADLSAIAKRIRNQHGKKIDLNGAMVVSLADAMVGDVRTALLILLGAVGLLLLVACANVAGLLLARASARRKELAVCVALGAGRFRLIQQFLAESFALSMAGGLLGVSLAFMAVKLLPSILPANLPRQQGIALNAPVLLFGFAATIGVSVSLGLFAAWRAGSGDLREALTSGSRSYTGTAASQRVRGVLVVGEIALTLIILVGAGLLGRSFLHLISTSAGFNQQNLITTQFSPPNPQGQLFAMDRAAIVRQIRLLDDVSARLRNIPGVEAVGLSGALPVAAGDNLASGTFLILNGRKPPTNFAEWDVIAQNLSQIGDAEYCVASAAYFRTLGIPLVRGRMFGDQDVWNAPHVAVISKTLAQQRWPNQDPIGQTIDFGNMDGNPKPLTIIGIAGDVRARGLDRPSNSIVYVNYRQRGMNANSSPTILMRTAMPMGRIASVARSIFHDLVPDAPVKFATFSDEMGGWLSDRRFLLLLVGVFAAVALGLAAVGIYGVVAFSVTRRTQEIGVRMALGAQRSDVLRLVVGEGARLAVLGVAIGIVASLAVTGLLSSLLFGVSATDPITFIGVAVLLSLVALLASYIPARRATRLDPTTALRYE